MEPFVPEKDQRITNESPAHPSKSDGGRTSSLILVLLVVALVGMGGALVAMIYSQKQSFDALQQNFQALQGQLAAPATTETATEAAPQAAEPEPATVAPEPAKAEEPAASAPADEPAPASAAELARLTASFEQLQKKIGNLEYRLNQLDNKVANAPTAGSGDTRALTQTTSRLSSEVSTLRKEILDMKLSLNDTDGGSKDWQVGISQRLSATEGEILALRQASRGSTGDGSLADAVHQLQQEMLRLKRQQRKLHPYIDEE